jgi:CDP-4-dehydro-6-deoxyglucose reductase/ferredoxin-NAD(P)+ reductase (naphthalene dioxygenase ferredoxin-specific)
VPTVTIIESEESFSAEDGETVLAAAQRAGIAFPYSCQAGNCGSCKCELVDGEIFELEYSEHALDPAERARNRILACRTQVWGDARIRRLDDEELVLHPSRVLQCRVLRLEPLTHDIRQVRLEVEAGGPFAFSAGQYAQVEFAPGYSKHYSMANTPEDDVLEFQVRHMPGGRCSSYVANTLKVGDSVTVSGPHGIAYLRDKHVGPVLLVAGGSGLAPIQSILGTMLQRSHAAPITLYFGVRSERDLYNEALLRGWSERHANFRYEVVLSETPGPVKRRRGFLHEAIAADFDAFAVLQAYIAGPPIMLDAVTAMLKEKGLPVRAIHADAFYNQP